MAKEKVPMQTVTPLPVYCAVCSTEGKATLFTVQLPRTPTASWLKMPAGWWVLMTKITKATDVHCRCPECLRMRGEPPPVRRAATVEQIQAAVCSHFGVTNKDLLGLDRFKSVAYARRVAMYLARAWTSASYPELGRKFARDSTTVLQAVRSMGRQSVDPNLRRDIEAITIRLAGVGAPPRET